MVYKIQKNETTQRNPNENATQDTQVPVSLASTLYPQSKLKAEKKKK